MKALVIGRVQGVGFRYSAIREARRLGVTGWVRNMEEGSVEVAAEGTPERVTAFLAWLQKGPPGAWVREVEVTEIAPAGFQEFTVRF